MQKCVTSSTLAGLIATQQATAAVKEPCPMHLEMHACQLLACRPGRRNAASSRTALQCAKPGRRRRCLRRGRGGLQSATCGRSWCAQATHELRHKADAQTAHGTSCALMQHNTHRSSALSSAHICKLSISCVLVRAGCVHLGCHLRAEVYRDFCIMRHS